MIFVCNLSGTAVNPVSKNFFEAVFLWKNRAAYNKANILTKD